MKLAPVKMITMVDSLVRISENITRKSVLDK